MTEPWLTKAELARELKVSTRTIERLGIQPTMRVGRQNRYLRSSAEAQLRDRPQADDNVISFPGRRERGAAA